MLKKLFFLLFKPISMLIGLDANYHCYMIKKQIGGGNFTIHWPFNIQGASNLVIRNHVSIGPGSTIYSTNAKVRIDEHVVIGPNLTIITGDHMRIIGRYTDTVTDAEKKPEYDQDVHIETDVWIGCNVTILKGVTIGRGSVVAAGAVITKSFPPYSLIGGVPAKQLKKLYSDEEIAIHEQGLRNGV